MCIRDRALIIPDVRAWLDSNPIEFFSALGAVNILLPRFYILLIYGHHI